MPGPVSQWNPGPAWDAPYVPSWCYPAPGPRQCTCGCHEGYHADDGECVRTARCGCVGFTEKLEQVSEWAVDGNGSPIEEVAS